jgi:putative transposase
MARPERLAGFDYVGPYRYFITVCTFDRRPVFTDATLAQSTISHFLEEAVRFGCAVVAYCVMPDHIHLLVEGQTEKADLRSFVAIAKQKSGFAFASRAGHRLWQKGYYERVLRDDQPTVDVIRYIVANPVRRKLVAEPIEYQFWGSGICSREEMIDLIALDRHR